VQSAAPTPAPVVINAFVNEPHKTKSSDDIKQDKMTTLEARIKAIEGVDLYEPVRLRRCV
jgi:hypothetical protein